MGIDDVGDQEDGNRKYCGGMHDGCLIIKDCLVRISSKCLLSSRLLEDPKVRGLDLIFMLAPPRRSLYQRSTTWVTRRHDIFSYPWTIVIPTRARERNWLTRKDCGSFLDDNSPKDGRIELASAVRRRLTGLGR